MFSTSNLRTFHYAHFQLAQTNDQCLLCNTHWFSILILLLILPQNPQNKLNVDQCLLHNKHWSMFECAQVGMCARVRKLELGNCANLQHPTMTQSLADFVKYNQWQLYYSIHNSNATHDTIASNAHSQKISWVFNNWTF
jgi:hypothetical protein